METLTLEAPTEEKILIYQNDAEINRVTQEVQTRLGILNRIFEHKTKSHQIAGITISPFAIGQHVFELQLKENEQLKTLHDAGIKAEATLPEHLQRLKDALTAWHNYKGHPSQNKFAFLKVDEATAAIDTEQLERYYIQRQLKIFLEGEKLAEFRKIEMICAYFEKNRMPSNQIHQSSFLWERIEPVGNGKYRPRWQQFAQR